MEKKTPGKGEGVNIDLLFTFFHTARGIWLEMTYTSFILSSLFQQSKLFLCQGGKVMLWGNQFKL
jgi:hypothetical protein